jgi:hypothetical protein
MLMPQVHQSQSSPNQTLIELIYALKSLAQQVELYHDDLLRRLDDEVNSRRHDSATFAGRSERMLERLEAVLDSRIGGVTKVIDEVRRVLDGHVRASEVAMNKVEAIDDRGDVTGRIEVTDKGDIRVLMNSTVLRKIWYGLIAIATSGGVYGAVKAVQSIFGE